MGMRRLILITLCGILLKVTSVQSQCDKGEIKQLRGEAGKSIILPTGRNEPTDVRDLFIWIILPDDVLVSFAHGQLLDEPQGTPSWISNYLSPCPIRIKHQMQIKDSQHHIHRLRERIHLDPVSGSLNITDLNLNDTGLYCGQVWKKKTPGSYHRFNVTVSGQHQVMGSSQAVLAIVGEEVVLPCHVEPPVNMLRKIVEWSRPDLKPPLKTIVLIWRYGRYLHEEQNPSYQDRTSLFNEMLSHGNISLKLSRVNISDEGTYQCSVPELGSSMIQLHVAAPVLTCEGGGIKEVIAKVGQTLLLPTGCPPVVHMYAKESKNPTSIILHCLATGFYPKDGVTLDIKRNGRVLEELDGIQSTDVRHNGDGTYQNEKHVEILRSDTSNFSCEVKHATSNMHVATDWDPDPQPGADWNFHPAVPWVIGVVLFLCPFAAYFLIMKKWNIGEINKEGTRMQQTILSWVLWRVRGSGGRSGDQPEQPGMPLLEEVVVGEEKQTGEPIQPPADAEEGSTESPIQVSGDGEGQTTQ